MSLFTTALAIICPFNANNLCDVTDTLLPHGAAEVGFQSAQRTE